MKNQKTRTVSSSIWIRLFGAIGFGLLGIFILFIIYYGSVDDSFSMTRNVFGFVGALLGIIAIRLQSKCPIRAISLIKLSISSFLGVLVGTTLMTTIAVFSSGGPLSVAVAEGLGAGSVLGPLLTLAFLMLRSSFMLFVGVANDERKENS